MKPILIFMAFALLTVPAIADVFDQGRPADGTVEALEWDIETINWKIACKIKVGKSEVSDLTAEAKKLFGSRYKPVLQNMIAKSLAGVTLTLDGEREGICRDMREQFPENAAP